MTMVELLHGDLEDRHEKKVINPYEVYHSSYVTFNPTQDELFRGSSRMGGAFLTPPPLPPILPKMCHTYPTMMKLDTVMSYLRKIKKIYKSCGTFLEFC